ncbi:unnamed protein product [Phytomonas sp. EM1]|nr:unnamed protein product [Phytomonas sp. EM1]|eukprot:CCW63233.1 unnamed protein product [Phytomonas sp. isolate EM1]
MLKFFLLAIFILVHLAKATVYSVDSGYVVELTQVIHRHGARSPLPNFNKELICGYEYPCGYLNNVGMSMLRAVGAYVRHRYNDPSIVKKPFFPGRRYNASLVYSRSTAKQRTIQSSSAFLSGVFPDFSLPVPYTVELNRDTLLNPDVYPSVISRLLDAKAQKALLNPIVDSYFTWKQLEEVAAEALTTESCQDYDLRYECVVRLYDIASCYKATNKLDDMPKLKMALEGARAVNTRRFSYLFGYDPDNELDRIQGTVAHKLVDEIVENMYSYLSSPSYRMYEYSTHDSMLTPLGITLGDYSEGTIDVPFAQTYLIELLQNVADKTYHVRVLRGFPQENEAEEDREFSFVQTDIKWYCMTQGNKAYIPINNICPLQDFVRYINSTKPDTQGGFCVIQKDQYERLECPASVEDSLPLTRFCQQYRTVCPREACPEGLVLGAADLQCYPVVTSS